MSGPDWLTQRLPAGRHRLWWAGACITLVLVGILLFSLDFGVFSAQLESLSWLWLLIALAFLFLEATLTAVRIRLFAPTRPTLGAASEANAWYVILVLSLPARLGDVAAIVVFERYLGLKKGAALASIVAQRLFDVLSIALIFLLVGLAMVDDLGVEADARPLAIAAVLVVLMAVIYLRPLLTLAARLFHGDRRPVGRVRRMLLKLILQARSWHHQFMNTPRALLALFVSLSKWVATMAGIAGVLMALHTDISTLQIWVASAVYNFTAIVPLHSIGGFGMGEVGLSAVLIGLGLTAGTAVGIALFLRLTLILFTVAYFLLVMAGRRLSRAVVAHG